MMHCVIVLSVDLAVVIARAIVLHLLAKPVSIIDPVDLCVFLALIFIRFYFMQLLIAAEPCIPVIQVESGIPQGIPVSFRISDVLLNMITLSIMSLPEVLRSASESATRLLLFCLAFSRVPLSFD